MRPYWAQSRWKLIRAYKEKIDKNRFLQNLLLDNMLLVDVYNQAKKLHIENDQKRIVFLVEAKSKDNQMLLETMKGMYASGMKDFVTAVDESSVILVKALEETDGYREVYESAKSIADTVSRRPWLISVFPMGRLSTN